MPVSAHVDPVTGIAHYSATGELTRDEILAAIEQVYRDSAYRSPWRALWEMIGATPALSGEELRALVAHVKANRPADTGKIAIVATKDVAFGMARMFELFASDEKLETRVFRDSESARQWLATDGAEPA